MSAGTRKITSRLCNAHRRQVKAISKRCRKTRMFMPTLVHKDDFLYMLSNVPRLVPVKWYVGQNLFRLAVFQRGFSVDNIAHAILHRNSAERYLKSTTTNCYESKRILGGNLLGFQIGNEPDLHARQGLRPASYGP